MFLGIRFPSPLRGEDSGGGEVTVPLSPPSSPSPSRGEGINGSFPLAGGKGLPGADDHEGEVAISLGAVARSGFDLHPLGV